MDLDNTFHDWSKVLYWMILTLPPPLPHPTPQIALNDRDLENLCPSIFV